MDVLKIESNITIRMTKEELKLVVESVDRAIMMIYSHVDDKTVGKGALIHELKPVSIEFTKLLSRVDYD